MKYIIEGGKKLTGEVKVSGNKNSVLACMAAALLTDEEVILENVPNISDVDVFMEIYKILGVGAERKDSTVRIQAKHIKINKLPEELTKRLRASILLVGPILQRVGEVSFTFPGGDVIGKRTIKVHLDGLSALGAKLSSDDLYFNLKSEGEITKDCSIFLDEASNTALENLILASVVGKRTVTLKNCPQEPQIIDLCEMLILMGAKISGAGNKTLVINGVEKLKSTLFRISDDYIELATYAIAAAITSGRLKIFCRNLDLEPITVILEKFGVEFLKEEDGFTVESKKLTAVEKVVTNIWPGFPTDLMSAVIVLATQATGETLCHDWMYESRMFFVDKLISMGAKITIADPHRVLVYGPTNLRGRELETPDIRAGMALVLAALIAEGRSVINKAELIERGYEDVVGKLSKLGADIKKA